MKAVTLKTFTIVYRRQGFTNMLRATVQAFSAEDALENWTAPVGAHGARAYAGRV
jgi:hypothetical protein